MSPRHTLTLTSCLILWGCSAGSASSMTILAEVGPSILTTDGRVPQCDYDPESPRIVPRAAMELGAAYRTHLLVHYASRVTITDAVVQLVDATGAAISPFTGQVGSDEDPASAYRALAGSVINPPADALPGTGVVLVDVVPAWVSRALQEATLLGDMEQADGLTALVTLVGRHPGGRREESEPYALPIDFCGRGSTPDWSRACWESQTRTNCPW